MLYVKNFSHFFLCIGEENLLAILRRRWWKYMILGLIDLEANYLVVKAYQYTTLTSVQVMKGPLKFLHIAHFEFNFLEICILHNRFPFSFLILLFCWKYILLSHNTSHPQFPLPPLLLALPHTLHPPDLLLQNRASLQVPTAKKKKIYMKVKAFI